MSKRTLLLIIVLAALTLVLLNMALRSPATPTQNIAVTPTPSAQSQLIFGALLAIPSSASGNFSYSLPITINSGANKITAVQLELQYDPKILANVSIQPGKFWENPVVLLNKIEEKTGRISYALGISPESTGKQGQDSVAILSFEVKSTISPTQTGIQFLPKSLVAAEGALESVLASTNSAQFMVGK